MVNKLEGDWKGSFINYVEGGSEVSIEGGSEDSKIHPSCNQKNSSAYKRQGGIEKLEFL